MKLRFTIITLIALTACSHQTSSNGATLTIDVPAADVPRVTEAFGSILGLGRNATQVEVEKATKQWIIGSTQDYERRKNIVQFTPPPLEMQPTPTAAPSPTPTPTP